MVNDNIAQEFESSESLDDMQAFEYTSIDYSDFVGKKVPIEVVRKEYVKSKFGYDEHGKNITLPPGQEVMVPVLKVETAPVTEFTDKEGKKIPIRASEMFSLKENIVNGKKVLGWSEHEKGALNKFLKKVKKSHPKELKGVIVQIITRPGSQEGQEFLGFIKE